MSEETKLAPCPWRFSRPWEDPKVYRCGAPCADCPANQQEPELESAKARISALETALIKSSVRADYLGGLIDRMGVDCSRIVEVTAPLYYEVDLIAGTIPDYAKRYKVEEDAAHDRAKHAMGSE